MKTLMPVTLILLLTFFAGALAAQGAAADPKPVYKLSPDKLDFGTIRRPRPVSERVIVEGLKPTDVAAVTTAKGGGLVVSFVALSNDRWGIDVIIKPQEFEPGALSDTVTVTVNGEKAAQLEVSFTIEERASSAALKTITIFAKERDEYTKSMLTPFRDNVNRGAQGGQPVYPEMYYTKVDLRYIEGENEKLYEEMAAGWEQMSNQRLTRPLPKAAMFAGPVLVADLSNMTAALNLAVIGQNFVQPKLLVRIYVDGDAAAIRKEHVAKFAQKYAGAVWDVLPLPAEARTKLPQGTEFYIEVPAGNNQVATKQGALKDLETTLEGIAGATSAAGTTQSSGGFKSEGTTVTPGAVVAGTNGAADAKAGENATGIAGMDIRVLFCIIAGAALLIGLIVFMMVRKQQAVLNEVSQRLTQMK